MFQFTVTKLLPLNEVCQHVSVLLYSLYLDIFQKKVRNGEKLIEIFFLL